MRFSFIYYYPNKENPAFGVSKIEAGYMFVFFNKNGKEVNNFSINEDVIKGQYSATGYEGAEGLAIENFRQYLRNERL